MLGTQVCGSPQTSVGGWVAEGPCSLCLGSSGDDSDAAQSWRPQRWYAQESPRALLKCRLPVLAPGGLGQEPRTSLIIQSPKIEISPGTHFEKAIEADHPQMPASIWSHSHMSAGTSVPLPASHPQAKAFRISGALHPWPSLGKRPHQPQAESCGACAAPGLLGRDLCPRSGLGGEPH